MYPPVTFIQDFVKSTPHPVFAQYKETNQCPPVCCRVDQVTTTDNGTHLLKIYVPDPLTGQAGQRVVHPSRLIPCSMHPDVSRPCRCITDPVFLM